ncbi:unnamed protein product [Chrysodeixis includens]|uniref:Uncharacterized protein n=1 Tax=Chrysodeixis includens TaxID=689277 RepID=A0A9N8Q1B3_CHRIL|nr:unnamed protein product [Chrysodeixis includens]
MGCTSSTPNMVNTSTAEKSIQFDEEMSDDQSKDTEEIIYRADTDPKEMTALPSSNALTEPIDIVRNKSNASLKTEKDSMENKHLSKSIADYTELSSLQEDVKANKLEDVVEKIVEFHSPEVEEPKPEQKLPEGSDKTEETKDVSKLAAMENTQENEHSDMDQEKEKDDAPVEATSPSQSESSRATRWEALADIAAELPPSLTVDPITGQIYALSK